MKTMTTRMFAALAALSAVFATALFLAGAASAATTYPPPSSSGSGGVHVTNPHPHAGGTIVVQGSGCQAGATITVSLDGNVLGTGKVNPQGKYSIPVRIPASTPPGQHTISVSGGNCAGSGVLGIEVLAPASNGSSGNLAGTGVAVVGIGALGAVLLIGGGLMLLAGRRRSSKHA